MIHIDRTPPPASFEGHPLRKRQQDRIRDHFSKPHDQRSERQFSDLWANSIPGFIKELRGVFANKCAYCETGLEGESDDIVLAFFRPTEGALGVSGAPSPDHYWWLSWEWSNLYLACPICIGEKGRTFPTKKPRVNPDTYGDGLQEEEPLLLDPCSSDDPLQHLLFEETGGVAPYNNSDRGRATIDVLSLNRNELLYARAESARKTKDLLRACLSSGVSNTDEVNNDISSNIKELILRCRLDQPYAGMTHQVLRRWLQEFVPPSETVHAILSAVLAVPKWQATIKDPTYKRLSSTEWHSTKLDELIETLSNNLDEHALPPDSSGNKLDHIIHDENLKTHSHIDEQIGHRLPNPPARDLLQLITTLESIPSGNDAAGEYHQFISETLESIFHPNLRKPVKEEKLHEGRKRVDIVFNNEADSGFFRNLSTQHKVHCPYIFFECKNYSKDPRNPEFDQLTGRFSERRGQFGVLVCRKVEDKRTMLQRCKDVAHDGRGFILVFEDDDIEELLRRRANNDFQGLNDYLDDLFRRLVM